MIIFELINLIVQLTSVVLQLTSFLIFELIKFIKSIEPRHEKTCLGFFRPGKTQTGLLSYRN